uniref:Uncharacterized protein n=1 Tax=Glossina palpalis gambiensis TaxID=67801 RepID=A0A1B0B4X8_9MUSC
MERVISVTTWPKNTQRKTYDAVYNCESCCWFVGVADSKSDAFLVIYINVFLNVCNFLFEIFDYFRQKYSPIHVILTDTADICIYYGNTGNPMGVQIFPLQSHFHAMWEN